MMGFRFQKTILAVVPCGFPPHADAEKVHIVCIEALQQPSNFQSNFLKRFTSSHVPEANFNH